MPVLKADVSVCRGFETNGFDLRLGHSLEPRRAAEFDLSESGRPALRTGSGIRNWGNFLHAAGMLILF